MTLRALTVALAVSAGAALMVPGTADAQHRQNRHDRYDRNDRNDRYDRRGRHDRYDRYDRHGRHDRRGTSYYYRSAPRYRYAPRYYGRYDWYDDGYYGGPRGYGYYPPPPAYHYHGRARCSSSHVGFYFGW